MENEAENDEEATRQRYSTVASSLEEDEPLYVDPELFNPAFLAERVGFSLTTDELYNLAMATHKATNGNSWATTLTSPLHIDVNMLSEATPSAMERFKTYLQEEYPYFALHFKRGDLLAFIPFLQPDAHNRPFILPKIKRLDFSDCHMTLNGDPNDWLKIYRCFPNIESFSFQRRDHTVLYTWERTGGFSQFLEAVPFLRNIRHFELNQCEIYKREHVLKFFRTVAAGHFSNLKTLDLKNSSLGHYGFGIFSDLVAAVPFLPQLETVDLSENRMFSQGVLAIAKGLAPLSHLRSLKLSNNNFKLRGNKALEAAFSSLTTLEELGLRDNDLYSEGDLKDYITRLKLPKLISY